jgi:hypothetical protein
LRQVGTLVIAEGLTVTGSECPVDGRLDAAEPGTCPWGGAQTPRVGDLIDRVAQRAMD